jgi:uncharacterized protein (TIGR01777 family)
MARDPLVFERRSTLPCSAEAAYRWHASSGALERLTPPWEGIELVSRRGGFADGAETVLRVPVGPVRRRWLARHRDHIPGRQFVDEQIEGPFASWVHTHRFIPRGADACDLEDRVEFEPPLGLPGRVFGEPFIRRTLERVFSYRHHVTHDDLLAHARLSGRPPLTIAITGATGLLGTNLAALLTTGGHRVVRVVRHPTSDHDLRWDPATGRIDAEGLEGVDAVVHLAGESIAGGRWTRAAKQRVRDSRVRGTRLLAETLARLGRRPAVLVSASAIGYYGDRGDALLDEQSGSGGGFLGEVCTAWEAATAPAWDAGIRVVNLRIGIVLTPAAGALAKMLPPFRLGLGGRLGSGKQWMSWISLDDTIGAIHHAIVSPALQGPVNAVAPEPVTNAEFTRTLARVLHRPALMPVPAAGLRLALGEMADTLLLASCRVVPAKLQASGYHFRHPTLESALRHLLGR